MHAKSESEALGKAFLRAVFVQGLSTKTADKVWDEAD